MRRPRIRIPLVALALSSLLGSGSAAAQGFHLKLDPALSESRAAITEGRPVYGSGERLFGRSDRDVTLEGDAEVRKAGSVIRADRLTYYQADDELLAAGRPVRLATPGPRAAPRCARRARRPAPTASPITRPTTSCSRPVACASRARATCSPARSSR